MTDTLENAAADMQEVDQQQLAEQLLARLGSRGRVGRLERAPEPAQQEGAEDAPEEEMAEHLGYDKHDPVGRTMATPATSPGQTLRTEIGPVEIEVPRDTDASFRPQIAKERQWRLTRVDEIVLSLTGRWLHHDPGDCRSPPAMSARRAWRCIAPHMLSTEQSFRHVSWT